MVALLAPCLPPACGAQQPSVLEQARSEAAAGHFDRAAGLYRQVLQTQPDSAEALGGLADAFESSGRWREAIPLLNRLVLLHPGNAARLFQLGRMESWQAGTRGRGLELLKRAADLEPANPDYQAGYAEVLSWESDQRPEAVRVLRGVLTVRPNHVASIGRLAEILSWSEASRPEAARLFERGLQLDPQNEGMLVNYAEMLSWDHASRPQAMKYFERALAQNSRNAQALTGEARLLAWSGRSQQALALYDKALSLDVSDPAALRGKAEILNWRGEHDQALGLLARAHIAEPNDSRTLLEMARADYGLGHYAEAKTELAQVQGVPGSEYEDLQRGVNHALGSYFQLGYGLRRNRRRLDYDRLEAMVSTPLGEANRVSIFYRPTLYRTSALDFNSNYYGLALDSQPTERLSTHAQVAGESYIGVPPQIDGTFDLRFHAWPSLEFDAGFERAAVEDTLLSTRGATFDGLFLGQVRSNLGSLRANYSNAKHHYDFGVRYADGVYTGRGLASNRRWGVDADLGKSLHSYHPYVRLAYQFSYISFDHDADFQLGQAPPRVTGGYFSPTRYFLNSGAIFLSHDFSRRVKWDAGGTLGAQNSETTTSSVSDAHFASSFSTHVLWNVYPQGDLRIGYDFLNVFNAFHRHLVLVTWRHYF